MQEVTRRDHISKKSQLPHRLHAMFRLRPPIELVMLPTRADERDPGLHRFSNTVWRSEKSPEPQSSALDLLLFDGSRERSSGIATIFEHCEAF
jgi:hypothetical protein